MVLTIGATKKNPGPTFHVSCWLFHRDPYFMAYYNPPHNWAVLDPLYNKTTSYIINRLYFLYTIYTQFI